MRGLSQAFALAVILLTSVVMSAQEVKPALQLRTLAGKNTFYVGERIALSLTLTGPGNKKYSIDTAGYDRSGRLNIDSFDVTTANGWSDPLAQYFSQGSIGGGLRGSEPLSSRPVTFKADLNEHIRFDQAGTYTVTATSHRVGTAREGGFPKEPYLAIVSNPIEIHILPATPEWQVAKLKAILATLGQPVRNPNIGNLPEQESAAIADLRYLDSPAAIEVLASNLREGSDDRQDGLKWAAILGLSGVPDARRDDALHALSRQLDDPAFPVGQSFLMTMADLEAAPHATADELRASYDARFLTVWQMALSELSRKQGAARAETAETLLSNAPGGGSPQLTASIAAIVANSLTALPVKRQILELEYKWDELSRQPMLPVLLALLHQPPSKFNSPFDSAPDLDAILLRRWFELDPEGAVRELDLLLASPTAPFTARSIGLLPGGPQPQFEAGWAQELLETDDYARQTILAALLVRFGTGAANAQVESKLDVVVGKAPCQSQAAMLAYVVKFNADQAGSLAARAMSSTHPTACYQTLFFCHRLLRARSSAGTSRHRQLAQSRPQRRRGWRALPANLRQRSRPAASPRTLPRVERNVVRPAQKGRPFHHLRIPHQYSWRKHRCGPHRQPGLACGPHRHRRGPAPVPRAADVRRPA